MQIVWVIEDTTETLMSGIDYLITKGDGLPIFDNFYAESCLLALDLTLFDTLVITYDHLIA